MKPLIDPINTDDGQFHGRDNQTGALATIVTPVWTNDMQDATRSVQREMITLLTAAGIKPAEATDNQLLAALRTLFLAEDDTRVSHALQKEENLSDVESATSALANLGGLPLSGGRMTGTLNLDGVKQGEYLQTGLSAGAEGAKNYLRKMRGGSSDTIWHETVQGGAGGSPRVPPITRTKSLSAQPRGFAPAWALPQVTAVRSRGISSMPPGHRSLIRMPPQAPVNTTPSSSRWPRLPVRIPIPSQWERWLPARLCSGTCI